MFCVLILVTVIALSLNWATGATGAGPLETGLRRCAFSARGGGGVVGLREAF